MTEQEFRDYLSDEVLFNPLDQLRTHIENKADQGYSAEAMLVAFNAEDHGGFHLAPSIALVKEGRRTALPLTAQQAFALASELMKMALAVNQDELAANKFHRSIMEIERLADLRAIGAEIRGRR